MAKASARRSVSRVLSRGALRHHGDGHPSGAVGRPTAHAADPRAGQRTSSPTGGCPSMGAPSYLALLRVEFARFTPSGGLRRRSASSLWHWSSPHGGRALPATLRCGARTFLTPSVGHPIDDARPSDRLADPAILPRARRDAQPISFGPTSNVIEPPLPSRMSRPSGSIETDEAPCMAAMKRCSVAMTAASRQAMAVDPI